MTVRTPITSLYDLANDLSEDTNQAGNTDYEAQQQIMADLLVQAMKEKYTLPSLPAPGVGNVPHFDWPPDTTSGSIGVLPSDTVTETVVAGAAARETVEGSLEVAANPMVPEGAATTEEIADLGIKLAGEDDEIAMQAADALAQIGTPEARAALLPGLYTPVRSAEVMAQLHSVWAKYNPV